MIAIVSTPTCPICDSPSRPETPFATADPDCLYWRCWDCQWLFSTPKSGADDRAFDEPEPASDRVRARPVLM